MIVSAAVTLGLLTIVIWSILSWVNRRKFGHWSKNGVAEVETEPGLRRLLKGHLNMCESDTKLYREMKKNGLPYGGVYEMGSPVLVVADLDMIRDICIKSFDHFTDMMFWDVEDTDSHVHYLLFNMRGQKWKEMRNTLTPAFTTGRIRRMMHIMDCGAEKMVKGCRKLAAKSDVVDVHQMVLRFTLDVIASAAFGVDTDVFENPDSIFMKMGHKWDNTLRGLNVLKISLLMFAPKIAKLFNFRLTDKEADDFLTRLVQDCITHREKTGEKRDDFLQLMIEAKSGRLQVDEAQDVTNGDQIQGDSNDKKLKLTDDMIIAQAFLFIMGGFDTVQILLDFALYEIALHPQIQETLFKELEQASKKDDGLNYDVISSLEYLNMVVSEVLRLHPAGFRLNRICTKPYQLPGSECTIQPGQLVMVPAYGVHYDSKYWPNPEEFDPLRFTKEKVAERHPMAYMPFGHGPRHCIGNRFALIETKVAIAKMVLAFKLERCEKTQVPLRISKTSFPLKAEGSIWLKLTPRN